MRILLVEDDELLGNGISLGLKQDNYVVEWVKNGLIADSMIKMEDFDAIILDLGLPKKDGLSVLKSARANGIKTPILILTAKNTSDDLIKSMNSGADDFLSKPFELNVLTARLNALIRRSQGQASTTVTLGPIEIDTASHIATKDGKLLKLSRREFTILKIALSNVGKVITRNTLINSLYNLDDDIDSNTLEVHIHNLRKKLDTDIIKTVRGVGYLIQDPSKITV
jgi:two-component system, OmpR family, response regulator QseB